MTSKWHVSQLASDSTQKNVFPWRKKTETDKNGFFLIRTENLPDFLILNTEFFYTDHGIWLALRKAGCEPGSSHNGYETPCPMRTIYMSQTPCTTPERHSMFHTRHVPDAMSQVMYGTPHTLGM